MNRNKKKVFSFFFIKSPSNLSNVFYCCSIMVINSNFIRKVRIFSVVYVRIMISEIVLENQLSKVVKVQFRFTFFGF